MRRLFALAVLLLAAPPVLAAPAPTPKPDRKGDAQKAKVRRVVYHYDVIEVVEVPAQAMPALLLLPPPPPLAPLPPPVPAQ
jgi:hypothetical protein